MNIWSKVLIGLILFSSLFLFYFAMRMLRTEQVWHKAVRSYDAPLENAQKKAELAVDGDRNATPPQQGIRDLRVKLHDFMVDRGRVWKNCVPQQVDPASGLSKVAVEFPDPHRIQDKSIIYVFEEGEAGRYLGEFKVEGVAEKLVTLTPTMKLSPRQLDKIKGTRAAWLLYERMPVDRHDVFAGYDQQQLAAMMPGVPANVLDEYLRNGQDAQPDDSEDRVMNGKYERQLRDYNVYFHEMHSQIASMQDQVAAATTDLGIVQKSRDVTQKEVELRQEEIDKEIKPELEVVSAELELATAYRQQLEDKLAEVQQEVDETIKKNKELAARWTELQFESAKRLNELINRERALTNSDY